MEYPNELVEAVKAVADALNGVSGNKIITTDTTDAVSIFADMGYADSLELYNKMKSGSANVDITVDTGAMGGIITLPLIALNYNNNTISFISLFASHYQDLALEIIWTIDIAEQDDFIGYMLHSDLSSWYNATESLEGMDSYLTIYEHPMPEE